MSTYRDLLAAKAREHDLRAWARNYEAILQHNGPWRELRGILYARIYEEEAGEHDE